MRASQLPSTLDGANFACKTSKVVPARSSPYRFPYDKGIDNYRLNERTMRLVWRIFVLVAGGISLRRIRKTLEDEAILTDEGLRLWNVNTIGKVIRNNMYRSHSCDAIKALVSS